MVLPTVCRVLSTPHSTQQSRPEPATQDPDVLVVSKAQMRWLEINGEYQFRASVATGYDQEGIGRLMLDKAECREHADVH